MRSGSLLAALTMALMLGAAGASGQTPSDAAQPDPFDLPDLRPPRFTLGGHVEVRPVAVRLDPASVFYRLRGGDAGERWQTVGNGQLLVDTGYRQGPVQAFARTVFDGAGGEGGWDGEVSLYEAWVSLKPTPSVSLDVGKRTMKWGKGYAWNPAAFLDRPKDPEDPALALEGVVVVSADLIRSFTGPLQTVAVTPVLVPVYDGVNESLGRTGHLNAGGKLYLLLWDTDLDVMFLSGGSRAARWGLDFARNLRPEIEVHGELAVAGDEEVRVIAADGRVVARRRGGASWLLGARYLARTNTTVIVEYFRRDFGFTADEMRQYFDAAGQTLGPPMPGVTPLPLPTLAGLARSGYADRQPMRNYVFARASQPDAFGQLYLNAALTTIYNVDDRSLLVMQEMQYRLAGNLELRTQIAGNIGARGTDFGERPGDARVEVRVRYSF
ncbi:MAG: hypothetical protein KJ061_15735 [Vicinamibacteraceae bacterium]|nr:hypothetical protein [Vicinamibacteraceae bacterium]